MLGAIAAAPLGPEASERGTVLSLADGIARVAGLPGAGLNEALIFDTGARGFVLSLEEDALHAAFLDPAAGVKAGSRVRRSGAVLSVPVGDTLLGRVLDPMGRPLDNRPAPATQAWLPAERPAPAIIDRDFVSAPMATGLVVVDAMFAIGHG